MENTRETMKATTSAFVLHSMFLYMKSCDQIDIMLTDNFSE